MPDAASTNPPPPTRSVRRRLVCYLSGFDPQGAPHYHRLYSEQAQQQASVSGYHLHVGPRHKAGPHIAWWDVKWTPPAGDPTEPVHTRYEFFRWDDIVRQQWPRGMTGLIGRIAWASTQLWRMGVMWRVLKTSWPRFIVIALPGFLLASLGFGGLALVSTTIWLISQGLAGGAGLMLLLGLPALVGGAWQAERRTYMSWLMRSMACLVRQGRGELPQLEARLDLLAEHLARQYCRTDIDEVLVVGHSSGAIMAMSITARALGKLEKLKTLQTPEISLLTLGHCTPMLSYQPSAQLFRQELVKLTHTPWLRWVDFGAPPDGCCFPLSDPSGPANIGTAPPNKPKLLNPRFAQLFTAQNYQSIRQDKYRCHFQYLMSSELAGDYDYFAITAGHQTLWDRFADKPSTDHFHQFQLLGGPGW